MKENKTLVLLTRSFPYSIKRESQFIKNELSFLSERFSKIIILPAHQGGKKDSTPENVAIDYSLTQPIKLTFLKKLMCFFIVLSKYDFYKEVLHNLYILKSRHTLNRLIWFMYEGLITENWVIDKIENEKIDLQNTLFYTYWIEGNTYGLARAKRKYGYLKFISRAHNIDVYLERWTPAYLPLRKEVFNNINSVYLPSKHSACYLKKNYPNAKCLFTVAYLGVKQEKYPPEYRVNKTMKIVSCSYIRPVKRVDLILESLIYFSKKYPAEKIEWHHIGDGKSFDIEEKLTFVPDNMDIYFHGYMKNQDIIDFYKNQNFDLFINLSEFEGLPVALMEAMSNGIPAIVTNVCGMPELVSTACGYIVPKESPEKDISSAIMNYIFLSEMEKKEMHKIAFKQAKDLCDNNANFTFFSDEIICY